MGKPIIEGDNPVHENTHVDLSTQKVGRGTRNLD